MQTNYPIVFEREESGVYSAYVVGVPVYAQGATRAAAERAIAKTFAAYLADTADERPTRAAAEVKVARVQRFARRPATVRIVGAAALLSARTSPRKAAASRANGKLGGRPRA